MEFLCKNCNQDRTFEKKRVTAGKSKLRGQYPVLSGFIRMRRKQLKLTQLDIAKVINVQDGATVSLVETGKKPLPVKHFEAVAELLQVPVTTLMEMAHLDETFALRRER